MEDAVKTRGIKRLAANSEPIVDFKKVKVDSHPRWHNQAYMLFLALRQHPDRCLPRGELIKEALRLDRQISRELKLPLVFRGKTPANSASASLTNNSDRYFVPFRIEGSRPTWFRLAYEPGDETKAVQAYQQWTQKLFEHDWPFLFGVPKAKIEASTDPMAEVNASYPTPPASNHAGEQEPVKVLMEDIQYIQTPQETDESLSPSRVVQVMKGSEDIVSEDMASEDMVSEDMASKDMASEDIVSEDMASEDIVSEDMVSEEVQLENKEADIKPETAMVSEEIQLENKEADIKLEDLDLTEVPKQWADIVYRAPSLIPGAGLGLFAKQRLPANAPIGFYFGVPMTEDEYDSLKDRVGRASEYSIMYRRTVLDATDDRGEPIQDETHARYCPFHFMNETESEKANMFFLEGAEVNQVICWTKGVIEPDQELLVWYGKDVQRHWGGSVLKP